MLSPGTQLGHFEITGTLGAGGMGEMYRALDAELGREVAIKVLPEDFARNAEHLTRFERDVKILASLEHENIRQLYDFHEEGDVHYFVLELIEGETLAERIDRGPLSVKETLPLFIQIAEALEAAHESGIIHRDLKPANIKITPEGKVKVLDFGMAKPIEPLHSVSSSEAREIATEGAITGTPSYMSPEQARGQEVDKGTDIWAFGCCLYETLTGKTPFEGKTISDLIPGILKGDPAWEALPDNTPREVENLLRRCLEKDTKRRLSWAGYISIDLEEAQETLKRDAEALISWNEEYSTLDIQRPILPPMDFPDVEDAPERVSLATSEQPIRKIAVLPFTSIASDKGREWFVDGMTDTLIGELGKIRSLSVQGRTSSMQFKGTEKSVLEIASQLDADALVEGSVVRAGNDVQITARLIDGRKDERIWGDFFQGTLDNAIGLQREVALAIAAEIHVTIAPEEHARLALAQSVSAKAQDAYFRGRHHWNKRTLEGVKEVLENFRHAIEIEPNYALAYVGLADTYLTLSGYGLLPPVEGSEKAHEFATKALTLDDSLGEAYATRGLAHLYPNWEGAEADFRRGIELSPEYAMSHQWFGLYLYRVGRTDEALAELLIAKGLEPCSLVMRNFLSRLYFYTRDHDKGIEESRSAIEISPGYWQARLLLAFHHFAQEDNDKGIEQLEKVVEIANIPYRTTALATLYGYTGRTEEAIALMDEPRVTTGDEAVRAEVYRDLGESEKALDWLEAGYEKRAIGLVELKIDWRWDSLRDEPRFQEIVRKINFPEN